MSSKKQRGLGRLLQDIMDIEQEKEVLRKMAYESILKELQNVKEENRLLKKEIKILKRNRQKLEIESENESDELLEIDRSKSKASSSRIGLPNIRRHPSYSEVSKYKHRRETKYHTITNEDTDKAKLAKQRYQRQKSAVEISENDLIYLRNSPILLKNSCKSPKNNGLNAIILENAEALKAENE